MNELIKIENKNGKQLVSARELYNFLGLDKSNFSRWLKKNITHNQFFAENEDYIILLKNGKNNVSKDITGLVINDEVNTDYCLTLDSAKKLAMLSRSEKGEEVRQYFLNCEKLAKKLAKQKFNLEWQEARQLASKEYLPMSEAVKETREAKGKEIKAFHYSNEANLICMVLKGMTVKKYKEAFNAGHFRDNLTSEELAMLTRLQSINTGLIHAGWDYDKRKQYLTEYYDKNKGRLRVVRSHDQVKLIQSNI